MLDHSEPSTSTALIERLPDDVLREIFGCCLPEERCQNQMVALNAPVLLAQVCQHWRYVALNHAVLWSWITLKTDWDHLRNERWMAGFHKVARRAELAPLSLQILSQPSRYWGTRPDTEKMHDTNVFRRLISPVSQSLTRLTLLSAPFKDLCTLPPGLLPFLERLVLEISPSNDYYHQQQMLHVSKIRAFEDAPVLRRVALGRFRFQNDSLLGLPLPLYNITHLVDATNGTRFFPEYYSACTQLEYLSVKLVALQVGKLVDQQEELDHPLPDFDTVKSLSISFWEDGRGKDIAYPGFFDHYDFPVLESLILEGNSTISFEKADCFTSTQVPRFLAKLRGLQHLTYLSITSSIVDISTLERILRATPNVRTLDINIKTGLNEFFQILDCSTPTHSDVLPLLDTLVLQVGSSVTPDRKHWSINPVDFNRHFVKPRLMLPHLLPTSSGPTFDRVVVYANSGEYVDDEVPFVGLLEWCDEEGFITFERHVMQGDRRRRSHGAWMDRDPRLQDWPELAGFDH